MNRTASLTRQKRGLLNRRRFEGSTTAGAPKRPELAQHFVRTCSDNSNPFDSPSPAGLAQHPHAALHRIHIGRANMAKDLCIVERVPHRVRLLRAGIVDLPEKSLGLNLSLTDSRPLGRVAAAMLSPIRSLAYFRAVIDELRAHPAPVTSNTFGSSSVKPSQSCRRASQNLRLLLTVNICRDKHVLCEVYQESGIGVRNHCGAEPARDIEPSINMNEKEDVVTRQPANITMRGNR